MRLYLVHHADAVSPGLDAERPLSAEGFAQAAALAARATGHGAAPAAIWHSGKLRARQTAEAFYRACSPFAEFKMIAGLRPDDPASRAAAAILGETRDIMLVGHMPNIAALLERLAPASAAFPLHGVVALQSDDGGVSWVESWRASPYD